MDRRVNIPVRVRRPIEYHDRSDLAQSNHDERAQVERANEPALEQEQVVKSAAPVEASRPFEADVTIEEEAWRDRALRLQAEMDNYRKRQRRLAQDQVEAERQRLLRAFLPIVDNMERALEAPTSNGEGLHQGVQLTQRQALQLLEKEGVEPIEAENRPFDPVWHEAVATIGRNGSNLAPNTVVQVLEPGYRLGKHLLRPARVIVTV